jgi:fucose permease
LNPIQAYLTSLGWIVEYLVDVRNGDLDKMGYVPAGFYGGGFLGRLLLAEPTHRFGERRMIFIYIVLCLALELVFWLVPDIITEAVAISFLGFFSGPFFATVRTSILCVRDDINVTRVYPLHRSSLPLKSGRLRSVRIYITINASK